MLKWEKFGVACAAEERESGQALSLQFQVQSWESSEKVSVLNYLSGQCSLNPTAF